MTGWTCGLDVVVVLTVAALELVTVARVVGDSTSGAAKVATADEAAGGADDETAAEEAAELVADEAGGLAT